MSKTIPNQDLNNKHQADYRERNREKLKLRMREWRKNHPERAKAQGLKWRTTFLASLNPEELKAQRAKEVQWAKKRHLKNKDKVFAAYGGYICKCCGEKEISFLSIDHINNDGYKLFKEGVHPKGTAFYGWLVKNSFPSGFQVLCMNCQFGKKNNKGICPHQSGKA